MDQRDEKEATIREDRKEDLEMRDKQGAREQKGKSEKVAGRRVFNICFQGNQPTILRLRHLLS